MNKHITLILSMEDWKLLEAARESINVELGQHLSIGIIDEHISASQLCIRVYYSNPSFLFVLGKVFMQKLISKMTDNTKEITRTVHDSILKFTCNFDEGPDTRVTINDQYLCWIVWDEVENFIKDFRVFLEKYRI